MLLFTPYTVSKQKQLNISNICCAFLWRQEQFLKMKSVSQVNNLNLLTLMSCSHWLTFLALNCDRPNGFTIIADAQYWNDMLLYSWLHFFGPSLACSRRVAVCLAVQPAITYCRHVGKISFCIVLGYIILSSGRRNASARTAEYRTKSPMLKVH